MAFTWNTLYLGNSSVLIDQIEGNSVSETAAQLVGSTFGSAADPLRKAVAEMTTDYSGGNTSVVDTDNDSANDTLTFDLMDGAGPQTTVFDGVAAYQATVTYVDGSTATVSAVIIQDTAGNLFLAPERSENADTEAYQAAPIQSISLDVLLTDQADLAPDRFQTDFLCFAATTQVATPTGQRPISELGVGDVVQTLDHGARPVRWVGRLGTDGGSGQPPVRIAAGALGRGLPVRDLILTQQHRVLVRSPVVRRMFNVDEVLIAAKQLVGLPGITLDEDTSPRVFIHILLDRHEILLAEGAPAESLFLGPVALDALPPADRIRCLSRAGAENRVGSIMELARPVPQGRRQRSLVNRHRKNPHLALLTGSAEMPNRRFGIVNISNQPTLIHLTGQFDQS